MRSLEISVRSRPRALLFLLIIAVPTSLFVAKTVRIALAQTWGESYDVKKVQWAIALDPGNPEFRYWLGTLYLSGGAGDLTEAVSSLRKAVELNPNEAKYWLGLAKGCFVTDDQACANCGFERAVELAPMKPGMEWEAATYYAATGDQGKTLAHLSRLLELSPDSANEVFQLTWRTFDDPTLVSQNLVAPSPNAAVKCAYLDFLAVKNRFDLTGAYWKEMAVNQSPVSARQSTTKTTVAGLVTADRRLTTEMQFDCVKPYLQQLLYAQQYEQAVMVWRDLLRLGIVKSPASDEDDKAKAASANIASASSPAVALASTPSLRDATPRDPGLSPAAASSPAALLAARHSQPATGLPSQEPRASSANLVFNANFAQPILNAGFDWQLNQQNYVTLDFTEGEGFSPTQRPTNISRVLRIDFTVPHNADDELIYQFVPVIPGQTYELKAYMRSEGITSDSGPRLRVIDPQCPQCLDVDTASATGTTPWHEASVQFTARAIPVVRISVWRPRSRTFPMDISGRAWIDDITLRQIQPPVASSQSPVSDEQSKLLSTVGF